MTIPEASQLVLQSSAMAGSGELYVLDMGKPVRILDLAENMIRLTGLEPYKDIDIVEIGLRPGEKLYEELLIKTACLGRTTNDRIFIERDEPLSREDIDRKLMTLRMALETDDAVAIRNALMQVVPTYRMPEEVNRMACEAEEVIKANARQVAG
jgi:FlaA1/EpsC-like NDP-sugar epimerase